MNFTFRLAVETGKNSMNTVQVTYFVFLTS